MVFVQGSWRMTRTIGAVLFGLVAAASSAEAQQFNGDSYLSKPAGTITFILTAGQRNSMMMAGFSLLPRWEITTSIYVFNADSDTATDEGYSSQIYAKYMVYENVAKTGGFAVKFGTGLDPGYLDTENRVKDAFKTYWSNAPLTLPFLNNRLQLDVMPGVSATSEYGTEKEVVWAFTHATRLAWYPISPKWSVVGEVIGAEGQGTAPPEWRAGWRWEPNASTVFAATWDEEFGGDNGAKFEVGLMLFTPPFFCIRGCR